MVLWLEKARSYCPDEVFMRVWDGRGRGVAWVRPRRRGNVSVACFALRAAHRGALLDPSPADAYLDAPREARDRRRRRTGAAAGPQLAKARDRVSVGRAGLAASPLPPTPCRPQASRVSLVF